MKTKLDEISDAYYKHDPAFPSTSTDGFGCVTTMGLSRREYFAAMAMQGLQASNFENGSQFIAKIAVEQADCLIKALNTEMEEG